MMGTMVNARTASVLIAASVLASCGYAKRTEVQAELARVQQELRQEMQQGDQALSGRIDQIDARTQALERELNQLRDEFRVAIERFEGLISFNMPVHFEFDDATIRPQDEAVLDRFAAIVKEYYPTATITVEGFTDPAGSAAYNLRLGQMRADAVRDYLVARGGLPQERLRSVSYGEAQERLISQGAQGPGAAGMENRRVALVIDFNGTPTQMPGRPTT